MFRELKRELARDLKPKLNLMLANQVSLVSRALL